MGNMKFRSVLLGVTHEKWLWIIQRRRTNERYYIWFNKIKPSKLCSKFAQFESRANLISLSPISRLFKIRKKKNFHNIKEFING